MRASTRIKFCVVAAVLVVIAGLCGFKAPLDALFNLIAGWAIYLDRVVPQIRISLTGVVTALVCMTTLAVGLHLFLRWLAAQMTHQGEGNQALAWSVRRTAAILGVVVLLFVAGTSAVGITHQTVWLATSSEVVTDRNRFRTPSRINLKNQAIAMMHYQEHRKAFPPAALLGSEGQPLLSWRVLLLPYLEEEELGSRFKLDEPWDSPHNLRLLPHIPNIYIDPTAPKATPSYYTHYRVFVGPGTPFEPGKRLRSPDDFPDGTSKTLLIVEAAEPVPWTKPEELIYDPLSPLPRLGGLVPGMINVVLADGSVRGLLTTVPEANLRAAITRNGGESLNLDDW